ncbi:MULTISPECIES: type IV secretion system protein VirB3 [unclassified Brevundimonas]|uniref:type IV secretion system protein VirB3 n=1 Tax=unclassified Brevundimonas TaxID=2622653 RepID=UPI000CFD3C60|nr:MULTISPECIES: type IV secretion system protein VirB3 [unclassified Brevundimonas]PRA27662.1 type IV secretion system protein VirB3 [Brevundimonas sp. MYb27]PQZ74974.1 type IV secretion system protein VirB3 [Brevundimonas sp. MYb31]PRB17620.1 type IV secretion system protein VirB3 [Brevundimonas sp. MYb52]PRB37992.1 type IV secretion system protein VirB3 [Brevundimonas sp. MYb46]PRB45378.1 type IV secretion system protein VirB3 [Brevundimonas sp. MYb33]
MAEERLAEDPLFLACTRPAMVMGVPMEAMGVNVILSGLVFLIGGSLLYLQVAPVLHMVFRAICRADHNAFRLLFVYVDTKGRARNAALWGGSSPSPLPLVRRYRAAELIRG